VPTSEVFRALNGGFGPATALNYRPGDAASLLAALQTGRNDLAPPALRLAPVIGDVLAALRGLPGARLARMSGSGSTCFALFDDETAARAADGVLRASAKGWWSAVGRLIAGREDIAV
jgi:4-diphosphocytidyl-2-C-methyl-D-erythritol kinase